VLDILVTSRRGTKAATRFFRKLLTGLRYVPETGKTGGGSAHRGSVLAVACSWLALNVLQFAVGGLAADTELPAQRCLPRFFPVSSITGSSISGLKTTV
jgi:hypothetical protein